MKKKMYKKNYVFFTNRREKCFHLDEKKFRNNYEYSLLSTYVLMTCIIMMSLITFLRVLGRFKLSFWISIFFIMISCYSLYLYNYSTLCMMYMYIDTYNANL